MVNRLDNGKYRIEYMGQTMDTLYWESISDSEFKQARDDYYTPPERDAVIGQLKKIVDGGSKLDLVTHYYFRDLMSRVKLHYNKWTIEDVFNCKELVEYMSAKARQNAKVYPPEWPLSRKMYKMFGLAGKGVASPPTQFSLKTVDAILAKYNVNGNWYDYSCGWGVRLLGAMRNKVNYFGTDPNVELVPRLERLKADYLEATGLKWLPSTAEIVCGGSETFHPEWEGKMGLCFSSPPYFDVEDYRYGNQSYKAGTTYRDWIRNYVAPTILNIQRYLVSGGHFLVNIKNMEKYKLADNWCEVAKRVGLEFLGTENMDVHNRSFGVVNGAGSNHQHNGDESIFVFRKP